MGPESGSAVMTTGFLSEIGIWFPAPIVHNYLCDSISRGCDTLFWTADMIVVHIHVCRKGTQVHNKKKMSLKQRAEVHLNTLVTLRGLRTLLIHAGQRGPRRKHRAVDVVNCCIFQLRTQDTSSSGKCKLCFQNTALFWHTCV